MKTIDMTRHEIKDKQLNVRLFPSLRDEFLSIVDGLEDRAWNHNGSPMRPGQLLEFLLAWYCKQSDAERLRIAHEAEQVHARWLRERRVGAQTPGTGSETGQAGKHQGKSTRPDDDNKRRQA